ncbi:MAG: hypothetical protein ACRYFZ_21590 [Janthinobacterium lividum]
MPPVYLLRCGVLAATSFLCLTLLTACENNAPADQLTVVQGTVTSADNGRPLPGVLMAVESFSKGYSFWSFAATGDSVRTDAQGQYTLHFYNKKGLYYAVSLQPYLSTAAYQPSRYAFITNDVNSGTQLGSNQRELTLGKTNTFDFKPDELRTLAVRIRNRNTRYQRLEWNYSYLHGNTLDTTAYLRNYYLPATGVKFRYFQYTAAGVLVKDTAVTLAVQNPAALPPDTVRATLTFIR